MEKHITKIVFCGVLLFLMMFFYTMTNITKPQHKYYLVVNITGYNKTELIFADVKILEFDSFEAMGEASKEVTAMADDNVIIKTSIVY